VEAIGRTHYVSHFNLSRHLNAPVSFAEITLTSVLGGSLMRYAYDLLAEQDRLQDLYEILKIQAAVYQ
jgi:hypothetical protein